MAIYQELRQTQLARESNVAVSTGQATLAELFGAPSYHSTEIPFHQDELRQRIDSFISVVREFRGGNRKNETPSPQGVELFVASDREKAVQVLDQLSKLRLLIQTKKELMRRLGGAADALFSRDKLPRKLQQVIGDLVPAKNLQMHEVPATMASLGETDHLITELQNMMTALYPDLEAEAGHVSETEGESTHELIGSPKGVESLVILLMIMQMMLAAVGAVSTWEDQLDAAMAGLTFDPDLPNPEEGDDDATDLLAQLEQFKDEFMAAFGSIENLNATLTQAISNMDSMFTGGETTTLTREQNDNDLDDIVLTSAGETGGEEEGNPEQESNSIVTRQTIPENLAREIIATLGPEGVDGINSLGIPINLSFDEGGDRVYYLRSGFETLGAESDALIETINTYLANPAVREQVEKGVSRGNYMQLLVSVDILNDGTAVAHLAITERNQAAYDAAFNGGELAGTTRLSVFGKTGESVTVTANHSAGKTEFMLLMDRETLAQHGIEVDTPQALVLGIGKLTEQGIFEDAEIFYFTPTDFEKNIREVAGAPTPVARFVLAGFSEGGEGESGADDDAEEAGGEVNRFNRPAIEANMNVNISAIEAKHGPMEWNAAYGMYESVDRPGYFYFPNLIVPTQDGTMSKEFEITQLSEFGIHSEKYGTDINFFNPEGGRFAYNLTQLAQEKSDEFLTLMIDEYGLTNLAGKTINTSFIEFENREDFENIADQASNTKTIMFYNPEEGRGGFAIGVHIVGDNVTLRVAFPPKERGAGPDNEKQIHTFFDAVLATALPAVDQLIGEETDDVNKIRISEVRGDSAFILQDVMSMIGNDPDRIHITNIQQWINITEN